jgi:hypothetical protein
MWKKSGDPPDAVVQAWELVCRGYDNAWAQIARVLGYDPELSRKKIKRDVERYSRLIAAAIDTGVDPRAEALAKYQRQEKELWALYGQAAGQVDTQTDGNIVTRTVHPRSHSLRLKCLRQLGDVTERQAALKGVATRREVHETGQEGPAQPTAYNIVIVPRKAEEDPDDPETATDQ